MIPLVELMKSRFAGFDAAFADWVGKSGETISCCKGCPEARSACCELLCLITWPEAAVLAETLRERGLVAEYLPRLQEQARRTSFPGVDAGTYFAARIPCAFLTDARECAFYDSRPGPCRYHVVISPPAACDDRTFGNQTASVDIVPVLAELLGPILSDMEKQIGQEAWQIAPLPVLVLAALKDLGEDVGEVITPEEWRAKYGEHAQVYHDAAKGRRERRRKP